MIGVRPSGTGLALASVVGGAVPSSSTEVAMGCEGGGSKVAQQVVLACSSGSAATDLFFPATGAISTDDYEGAKIDVEVEATSDAASIELYRRYQLSNDQLTWDTPVAMTTDTGAVSAVGRDYGTAYTTMPATKRFVRFGFETNQKSGAAIEQMRVRISTHLASR
jgi:hypothetical protein